MLCWYFRISLFILKWQSYILHIANARFQLVLYIALLLFQFLQKRIHFINLSFGIFLISVPRNACSASNYSAFLSIGVRSATSKFKAFAILQAINNLHWELSLLIISLIVERWTPHFLKNLWLCNFVWLFPMQLSCCQALPFESYFHSSFKKL